MAKIPEFERRQLASSVVGTPGEDRSGQMILNTVSDTLNKGVAVGTELYKEREKAKNDTLVAKSQIDFMQEIEDETLAHEQEFAAFKGDPAERQRVYEDRIRTLFATRVNAMPTNDSKVRFEREGYQLVGRSLMREQERSSAQQSLVARGDTLDGLNTLATQAAKMGASTQIPLATKLQQIENYKSLATNLIDKSAKNLTPNDKAMLDEKGPEMILKGFAASSMMENPHELVQAIDSGKFDQLNPEEKQELRNGAIKNIKNLEERGKVNALFSDFEANTGIFDKFAKGDPSAMVDLQNIPDTEQRKIMMSMLLGDTANAVDSFDAQFDLMNKMRELEIDSSTKQSKANMEELVNFTGTVAQYASEGKITAKTANDYMKKLAVPLYEKVKNPGGSFSNALLSAWEGIKSFSISWFNRSGNAAASKEDKKRAVSIYNDFQTILGKQKEVNSSTVAASIQQALSMDAVRRFPKLSGVDGVVTDTFSATGKVTATGIPGTGSAKPSAKAPKEEMVSVKSPKNVVKKVPKAVATQLLSSNLGYEVVDANT
jgi:hypothetical protein